MSLSGEDVAELDTVPRPFLKKILQRSGVRRILSNTGWLAGDRLIRLGVGLFVTSWVARYLGPGQFGLLNYAVAFVFLFSILGALGLDSIVIRGLVQDPAAKDRLLCTAFCVKFTGGLLGYSLAQATLFFSHADRTTTALIAIIGLGTLVQATDVVDYWFQSQVKAKWSVLAKNTAFFAITAFKIALLTLHAGIIWFGVSALLEIAMGACGMIFFLIRLGEAPATWKFDPQLARRLLSQSWPLFLSGISVMVYMRIDQVMLEKMCGQSAVGLYSAAVRISELFYFVPTALASSILPSIVRSRALSKEIYLGRIQKYFNLSALMAVAVAVPISLGSNLIIGTLYGAQFHGVATILTVHVWASLFVFMGVARGQYLLAEGKVVFLMIATASGAVTTILLNLLLIPRFGVFGSAYATVAAYCVSDLLSSFCYKGTFQTGIMQLKALFVPLTLVRLLRDREI
jgi:PST family polysaccharide transporter